MESIPKLYEINFERFSVSSNTDGFSMVKKSVINITTPTTGNALSVAYTRKIKLIQIFKQLSRVCPTFIKFIHAPARIHESLLTGIIWVAFRTNINRNRAATGGRPGFYDIPASTFELCLFISWMYIFFHCFHLLKKLY